VASIDSLDSFNVNRPKIMPHCSVGLDVASFNPRGIPSLD
jgi:hypothetical protein